MKPDLKGVVQVDQVSCDLGDPSGYRGGHRPFTTETWRQAAGVDQVL